MISADRAAADLHNLLLLHSFVIRYTPVGIPISIVAGIISRETDGDPSLYVGDHGRGYGPMQVDIATSPGFCARWKEGLETPESGIKEGCRILAQKKYSADHHPYTAVMSPDDRLRIAIAAYNCGNVNVRHALESGEDIDSRTTGRDYSRDVLDRAAFLRQHGFG